MANNKGQRVAAFTLALLFLLTTIGTAVYVIWQLRSEDSGIITEDTTVTQQPEDANGACGSKTYAAVEPRPIPDVKTASTPVAELQTVDVKVGDGQEVQPGDCVAALYYGTLAANGEKFDGNYETGKPIEFSLSGVIEGWTEGIPGMKVGGIRRLVIPADMAYGETAQGSIPANSDLVFEVEIINTRSAE